MHNGMNVQASLKKNHIDIYIYIYIDDMLVKSESQDNHLTRLKVTFQLMRQY